MSYNFIDQNIVASCLIQAHTDDSFYEPIVNSHTGYASDGNFYSLGSIVNGHQQASWFTEFGTNSFRGNTAAFPSFGLVLLSPVSLVILNQGKAVKHAEELPLWMQFILGDNNALANNYNASIQGFLPMGVCYADGVISVTYSPDAGNQPDPLTHPILPPFGSPYPAIPVQSHMVVSVDFVRDTVYLDVAA